MIKSAEVVVKEIEFERADELTGCDEDEGEIEGSDDDACEGVRDGPDAAAAAPGRKRLDAA